MSGITISVSSVDSSVPKISDTASPLFVSRWFLWLAAFVGANLLQFGFTNFCPLALILKKLGVPESRLSCGN